mmetsp:Transcript_40982/g.86128  ORF Transcript_40982/g.86128 Transcript_40982/m.86128 type:complete len:406 (+) Transcript_40982:199-1416(+)
MDEVNHGRCRCMNQGRCHQCSRISQHVTPRRTSPRASFLILAAIASTTTTRGGVLAFTGIHTRGLNPAQKQKHNISPSFPQPLVPSSQFHPIGTSPPALLHLSSKDEAATILTPPNTNNFDPSTPQQITPPPPPPLALNPRALLDDRTFQTIVMSSVTTFLLLCFVCTTATATITPSSIPSTALATYATLLADHPLPTKSLTSGVLCGISDCIAQFRDPSRREFNYGRLIRFAGKGCIGGIIWMFWYDNLDRFLDLNNDVNIYKLIGITGGSAYHWIREHIAIATTLLSILIEQFFWCPIVFGTFEIPVSTLLNGGSFATVPKEVDSKLNGLLLSNAKVWTLANVVIYNAPVAWRPAVSNVVDVLWQSIVSDVAADCGKVGGDICEVVDEDDNKDFSFFAEKSRL